MALDEFPSLGIRFISYQENIDTSSASGQAMFTIVSAVAQLERDTIRERVNAGISNARAHGTRFGRPTVKVNCEQILNSERRATACNRLHQIWKSAMAQFGLDFETH
jgi:DNA invertase Pin-like site-specific DNA recombinase